MLCIVPHIRFRTCETDVVLDVFIRVGDVCHVFASIVACADVYVITVLNMCVCRRC